MIDFLSYPHFIFPLILFFKYLHIKKENFLLVESNTQGLQSLPLIVFNTKVEIVF